MCESCHLDYRNIFVIKNILARNSSLIFRNPLLNKVKMNDKQNQVSFEPDVLAAALHF